MTDKEILQKVIDKAKINGFNLAKLWCLDERELWMDFKEKIIFSHDFAKAFWGEEKITVDIHRGFTSFPRYENVMSWQYHLSKMVLEKEPLKYLEKFL